MSIRPRASCLALFLVLYSTSAQSPRQQTQAPDVPSLKESSDSWREVMASELEPQTFYCPIAYTRAPFVNVHALYRRGAPGIAEARTESTEPVGERNFLLAGQQTAELRPTTVSDDIA
jgi:hypothetical protein